MHFSACQREAQEITRPDEGANLGKQTEIVFDEHGKRR
jgi:hypothetical protein